MPVTTSEEMYAGVQSAVADCDMLVMCAAVADYKPARVSSQKIKKENAERISRAGPDARHSLCRRARTAFVPCRWLRRGNKQCRRKRDEKTARKKLRHDRRERCQSQRNPEWKVTENEVDNFLS